MNELSGGEKFPKMETLKKQRRELAEKKKTLYAEYRQTQQDMCKAVAVKAGIDHLPGLTYPSALGHFVLKQPGLGMFPNKHFGGPTASKNFRVWPHPN